MNIRSPTLFIAIMLGRVSWTHSHGAIIEKVCSSLSSLSIINKYYLYTSSASVDDTSFPSSSSQNLSKTHFKSCLLEFSRVVKSIISNFSGRFDPKVDGFAACSYSFDELLLSICHGSPETCRKFFRVSCWKPEHVHELLLGFELAVRNLGHDARIIGCLWEIFKRTAHTNEGFKHLSQSYEFMASMLIRAGMHREVESLLSTVEREGHFMFSDEIYSGLIEGYVKAGELETAFLIYDKMKRKGLVTLSSCYRALIDLLMKEHKTNYVLCVYEDLLEMGFRVDDVEALNLEVLAAFLCQKGKIKETRKLLKKIVATGREPGKSVLRKVADVYCEKKDFEDLLGFFAEMKCAPDIFVGNKIIFSLCCHFGIMRAHSFLWYLENLGFRPNEITFGIFIAWSCREGKLRDAFVYLSEILSRGIVPDRRSYNALISGLCLGGMEEHTGAVLHELIDNGIEPNLTTYRALLAGYSRARKFNKVKLIVSEMLNHGLTFMSPLEDPIPKAFSILGFNPMTIKVKRDNDSKNFRTEFFDELGNGLYLDTNLDEFERILTGVLEDSLTPDFNLLVMRECCQKNVEDALLLVDEMIQWGQELSVPALSALIKLLCESSCHVKAIPSLLDKMPQLFVQLDHETLNFIVHILSKNGFAEKCKFLVDEVYWKNLPITNTTITALLVGFCKIGSMNDIRRYWDLLCKGNWVPEWGDFVTILDSLCQRNVLEKLLDKVLSLCNIMIATNPGKGMHVVEVFVQTLCCSGMTDVAQILVNELQWKHFVLDNAIYTHLIKGYCHEKRFSDALVVFDAIQYDKLSLPLDTLLPFLTKLCQFNRVVNAVALKNKYLRDHSSSSLSLYTALINGCCRSGKIAEADALLTELISEKVSPNDKIYNAVLQGHCLAIDLEIAKELLCIMIRRRITFSVSTYRNLVILMCRKGMFHFALRLKTLMLAENKFSPSVTYNILIFYLFEMGKPFLVDSILDEMRDNGMQIDQVGYNFLIYGFSIHKEMPRSVTYLNTMISKGLRPSNRNLRAVIQYLCRNGQIQNAVQLSKQMELRGWIHNSTLLYALIEGLLTQGKIHQAEIFLVRIEKNGLIPSTVNYENLIRKFCHYDRLKIAVNLLDQILKKRSIPDSTTYDCIVQSFCACNKLDRAMVFCNEMLAMNLKPCMDTWDALIEKSCISARPSKAETLLVSMVELGEIPSKKMYSSIIDRYRVENNMSKASELLQRMQQHGYEPDFTTQWSLISSLKSLSDQKPSTGTQGFLSQLLHESGFPSRKTKQKL